MLMKIYTLTLSPAYDVHAVARKITACHENLAAVQSREAGGKGVNISRALHSYGVENTAVIVLGSQNSGDYRQVLAESGLSCILFEQEGRIRENLTIHCPDEPETRISFLPSAPEMCWTISLKAALCRSSGSPKYSDRRKKARLSKTLTESTGEKIRLSMRKTPTFSLKEQKRARM